MNAPASPINLSPKARFQQSNDTISRHRAMLETREFERASDTAVIQYAALIAETVKDANSAVAAGFKLQAVFEFLHTLRNLGEQPQRAVPTDRNDNLKHNV